MESLVDAPKCLRDEAQCRARTALLANPAMRALATFVQRLRAAVPDGGIPDFDPLDGGVEAEVLFLLEAPGPRAVASGFVSRNNPDETAKNWHELNVEAGIDRRRTVIWNIVPWYIGKDGRIRAAGAADITAGLPYLRELLALLPRLRLVVLVGRKAGAVRKSIHAWAPQLAIFELPHPSPMFVNRERHHRRRILDGLIAVRRALDGPGNRTT